MSTSIDPFDPSTHRGSSSRSCGANGMPPSGGRITCAHSLHKQLDNR
ncbi:hypothetical protein BSU04_31555 [Caballeronia sordidicola]|uniref:Uncharacterized protein n=1 Tax=Caballeronia sordidicola TaxID=196367 RepID=A0A226WTP8_CABSO|nr:hypothetical protein BSU04_31555 [Caballeronia sordidicola]